MADQTGRQDTLAQALEAIDQKDKPAAKKKLEEVLKEQPDFSLAQIDLKSLVQ